MLRPTLVFMGSDYCGIEDKNELIELAMSIELLHVSSLIYDDIIDRDVKRRGVKSVHIKYGNERAMLAGNALISKSVELSSNYGPTVLQRTAKAAMEMCAGEALDYSYQSTKTIPNIEQYLVVSELKSASLIGAAASAASNYKGYKHSEALDKFGRLFGIGFQIRDDVFDFVESGTARNNASNDMRTYRPNAVRSVMATSKSGRNAISTAIELNNKYINKALLELAPSEKMVFSEYADIIRLDKREFV